MRNIFLTILTMAVGLAAAGPGFAQDSMSSRHDNLPSENSLGSIAGASYQSRNTQDGVVLTVTAKDPATVKKIQEAARKLAAVKAVSTSPDEVVVCPVEGTKIRKSKAYDSTVYKGRTYYFCCSGCKPTFLKNPAQYAQ